MRILLYTLIFILTFNTPALAKKPLVDLWKGSFNSVDKFEVQISDQTSPAFLIYFNQVDVETTIAVETAIDDMTVTVTDATGIVDNSYIGIFSTTTNRFYQGHVIGAPSGNIVTLDTPIDSVFPVGSTFGSGTEHLNVDGSVTTEVFALRGADPGLDVTLDITKITIMMITDSAVDLSDFGNITGGLTRGLVMRGVDGFTYNFGNIKTNSDMATNKGNVALLLQNSTCGAVPRGLVFLFVFI